MSDKSFVPPSGEAFEVRRLPGGKLEVKGSEGPPLIVGQSAELSRIDHQTKRAFLTGERSRGLFWIFRCRGKRVLSWPGGSLDLDANELSDSGANAGGKLKPLKLTMPGKVVAVKVKEGQLVEAEQGLVVVEAMKMENLLLAPARAKVSRVHVNPGDRLDAGALLVSFEAVEK